MVDMPLLNKCRLIKLMVLLVVLIPGAKDVAADIFSYRDANGVLHLGNSREARAKGELFMKESPRFSVKDPKDKSEIISLIETTAKKHKVDPDLAKAVAKAESSFRPDAVSPKGAIGVMQLMPDTAKRFKVKDIYRAQDNIDGGIRYLKLLLNMFPRDMKLAIAAYNAGENRVIKSGHKIPKIKETQEYVDRVVRFYNAYKGGKSDLQTDVKVGRPVKKTQHKNGIIVISNL